MSSTKYYKRVFLNPDSEGMAAFEASVESVKNRSLYASFSITDCSRKVSLEFGAYGRDGVEDAKKKVTLLIQELQEFERVLVENLDKLEEVVDDED